MKIRKVYKMTNKELAIKVVAEDIIKKLNLTQNMYNAYIGATQKK